MLDEPEKILSSLSPDNTKTIKMRVENGFLVVELEAEKIGTIISSVDDIIVNCIVAEKLLRC
ncbi:MAG: hypothetical protein PWR13_68 [Archaeoglobi archaeon]|nr:hypothetical protein [Archaeoglobi archaeon]MDK2781040.1 hypothetical protein [Archaeoglobi archaeon]